MKMPSLIVLLITIISFRLSCSRSHFECITIPGLASAPQHQVADRDARGRVDRVRPPVPQVGEADDTAGVEEAADM